MEGYFNSSGYTERSEPCRPSSLSLPSSRNGGNRKVSVPWTSRDDLQEGLYSRQRLAACAIRGDERPTAGNVSPQSGGRVARAGRRSTTHLLVAGRSRGMTKLGRGLQKDRATAVLPMWFVGRDKRRRTGLTWSGERQPGRGGWLGECSVGCLVRWEAPSALYGEARGWLLLC